MRMVLAFKFNGTTQNVRVPYVPSMSGTTNLTLSCWIRASSTASGTIVSRHIPASTANAVFILDVNNSTLRMGIGQSGFLSMYSTTRASGGSIAANQWTHVVGTWNGTTITTYVNGKIGGTASLSGSIVNVSSPLSIASYYNGSSSSSYFNGEIDGLRIYNRELSQNEIITINTCRGTDAILSGIVVDFDFRSLPRNFSMVQNQTVQDFGPNNISGMNTVSGTVATETILTSRTY